VLSFLTVISVHTLGNSGYSDYDILYYSNLFFIIIFFLIFYEYKSAKHREQLLVGVHINIYVCNVQA